MGNKTKSFAAAAALGFALLFFGPATSTAQAERFGRHGSFQGRHELFSGRSFSHRSFGSFRHRGFVRPFHRFAPRAFYGYQRPYRLVRVFVYDPYPRWVYRRVYSGGPYAGAYGGY
jgi:hypothetical protein